MPTSLVLDTDLGTDVDDVLALATILGSPEIALAGVTTVYGDVLLRARMVARVARIAHRDVGPIVPGRSEPRSGRDIYWAGHEGALFDGLDQEQVSDGDPIALLAQAPAVAPIGPLTNAAEAVEFPGQAIEHLYVMGGDFSRSKAEHNVKCDIDAAAAVFASGVPATVIGLEQTTRVRLGAAEVAEIEAAGPLGELLAAEMRQYWQATGQASNVPHDPQAILMLADPGLFTFATGRITVTPEGITEFTAGDGPHRIVTDLAPAIVARGIVDRIVKACRG